MQAWVITDLNGYPIGIRETVEDVIEAAKNISKIAIREDKNHFPEEAETIRLVPDLCDDLLMVNVYLKDVRAYTYMTVCAQRFDSTVIINDW